MQDHIYLLKMHCDITGTVFINGTQAGDITGRELILPAGGETLLQFFPFACSSMPISRKLVFTPEVDIIENDGCIEIMEWPDGVADVYIHPSVIPTTDAIPYVIKAVEYRVGQHRFNALVYFDRTVNFAIEDASHKILFAYPFPFKPIDVKISVKVIAERTIVIAEVRQGRKHVLAVSHGNEISMLFFEPCIELQNDASSLFVIEDIGDPFNMVQRKRFSVKEKRFTEQSLIPYGQKQQQICSRETIAKSFALYIKYGAPNLAMNYMAQSLLADLSAGDIGEFFGEFTKVLPYRNGEVSLAYQKRENIFTVRVFRFEFDAEDKITNIEEL